MSNKIDGKISGLDFNHDGFEDKVIKEKTGSSDVVKLPDGGVKISISDAVTFKPALKNPFSDKETYLPFDTPMPCGHDVDDDRPDPYVHFVWGYTGLTLPFYEEAGQMPFLVGQKILFGDSKTGTIQTFKVVIVADTSKGAEEASASQATALLSDCQEKKLEELVWITSTNEKLDFRSILKGVDDPALAGGMTAPEKKILDFVKQILDETKQSKVVNEDKIKRWAGQFDKDPILNQAVYLAILRNCERLK